MSKFKGVFAQFLPKFWLICLLILRAYDSKYAGNDSWHDTINISFVSLWLCEVFLHLLKRDFFSFSPILFITFKKDCKSQIYCWIYKTICCSQQILSHIGSESKENLSKFGKKMSKNTFEFWHFLSEAAEAVWGQKSFKWLIRHKFPLLRKALNISFW